ncbi:Uncharacterised protein [Campylobacter sputorum subsp. bubulus]|uniref:Uncharacterized protein n=1 Tax=Campylobacter sputorum subsp. sputorum TaxID=32024 RepID=A0A381DL48_9BACT|nr:hypothetical protein [Campylobacter sputorum]ASM34732.1 putative membrane protein [Campylobacter sputorum aubsp. sputorum RM3237]ASM36393.1 hypothetical protein CSF_0487 [Campylobacter sputorum bv. faecalis CCUG 20703]QEL04923.1 putative membrane protein [Campylobacter sputorum subsp. sputorum]SUX10005.1 Uncharacterised protein [Campylobacter sputorum subsp. bubulus]SUX11409.1 Uncharacterised protein [Campylobacter sputorum subsp. sputorum]
MEFLMVLMFLLAGIYIWLKPHKQKLVFCFAYLGIFILIFMMAYVNKFTILPMGNF